MATPKKKATAKKTPKKAESKPVEPEVKLPEVQEEVGECFEGVTYDDVFEAVYAEERERGECDREALARASDVCARLGLSEDLPDSLPEEVGFYDLRHEQDHVYPGGKNKVARKGGRVVVRPPEQVEGIVIHQTAVNFSVSRRQVNASGGDENLALARRALDVACHAMAFRKGFFVAAHDLRTYVHHGNRFNAKSLGLEIDGRYPGLMDDPSTVAREDLKTTWKGDPTELTDLTVKAACAALAFLVLEGRKQGMPIKYIWAHRQSSINRRSDPGEEIWKRVVLEYAVPELGLETMPEFGARGRPIPKKWDPNGVGKY